MAASDYLGKGLLAPVLRDLLDEEPPVRFEIVTTHSRAGVRLVVGGDVDLAVVTGQETPRGLEDRHLFDQPFVWVGPRRGARSDAAHRAAAPRAGAAAGRREPRAARCSTSTSPTSASGRVSTIDVPSVSLLLSYVSGGLGIGLVPALALGRGAGRPRRERARAGPGVARRAGVARGGAPSAGARAARALLATAGARVGARLARRRT